MTTQEAKAILQLYRPHADKTGQEDTDPALQDALALARQDPELGQWLQNHLATQQQLREKFRTLPVPSDLPGQILAAAKTIRRPWSSTTALPWTLAAAALVFLAALASIYRYQTAPDRFVHFQNRMVGSVLREYRMNIVTNQPEVVRQYLASRQAPASYHIPPPLQSLSLTGAGLLRWQNHPVTMLCFDRGTNQMLFLFVLNREAPRRPPPPKPELQQVNKLQTASWTRGPWTYLLAGEPGQGYPEDYLSHLAP